MEYTDLELNKMMAELEGYKPVIVAEMVKTNDSFNYAPIEHQSNKGTHNYNKNKARILDLMFKYKVSVFYPVKVISIASELSGKPPLARIDYKSESEIPRAMIMCILKSENII